MNPKTIQELEAKAIELRAKYGSSAVVECAVWAHSFEHGTRTEWRIHVVSNKPDNSDGAAFTHGSMERVESEIATALDPANRASRAFAQAEKLEAEAAKIRSEFGGAK